ncbi:MAG: thioesterase family protein [Bowdeniella nasicola]|nr:thioesterase family protein [Bowdeniella nasicola]
MTAIDVPIPIRWVDIDAYSHVNNAAMLTLLEEARIAVFWRGYGLKERVASFGADGDTGTFIARQEIEYLKPVTLRDEPIPVSMWVSKIGSASVVVDYTIPAADDSVAVKARTVVVFVDRETEKPRRINDVERAALEGLQAEPLEFRRG